MVRCPATGQKRVLGSPELELRVFVSHLDTEPQCSARTINAALINIELSLQPLFLVFCCCLFVFN